MSIEAFAKENIRRQVSDVQDKGFFRVWTEVCWRLYENAIRNEQLGPDDEPPLNKRDFLQYRRGSGRPSFISDMYYIDPKTLTFYFYEIEDTHPLEENKLRRMRNWIIDVGDEEGWRGRVIVTDRYGFNHRLVFAYEHSFGPEPYPENEIELRFPKVFRPVGQPD